MVKHRAGVGRRMPVLSDPTLPSVREVHLGWACRHVRDHSITRNTLVALVDATPSSSRQGDGALEQAIRLDTKVLLRERVKRQRRLRRGLPRTDRVMSQDQRQCPAARKSRTAWVTSFRPPRSGSSQTAASSINKRLPPMCTVDTASAPPSAPTRSSPQSAASPYLRWTMPSSVVTTGPPHPRRRRRRTSRTNRPPRRRCSTQRQLPHRRKRAWASGLIQPANVWSDLSPTCRSCFGPGGRPRTVKDAAGIYGAPEMQPVFPLFCVHEHMYMCMVA
jgi:hypothetical protein